MMEVLQVWIGMEVLQVTILYSLGGSHRSSQNILEQHVGQGMSGATTVSFMVIMVLICGKHIAR